MFEDDKHEQSKTLHGFTLDFKGFYRDTTHIFEAYSIY